MTEIFKLKNGVKKYEWGSPDDIPRFLGVESDGGPWAELWMGSHPGSPSLAVLPSGEVDLGELIARDPRRYLGEKAARQFGELPFLFKLLAAEKPLSVQAHPNKAQAVEGFERENRAGFAPDAPDRCYRDSNHKPEIICALTPFTGMCGFRNPDEIHRLLRDFFKSAHAFLCNGFDPLVHAIATSALALQEFLSMLFDLPVAVREALSEYILSIQKPDVQDGLEWELMRNFARRYPGDPAVIAPLYLNVFRLQPGEAVFLDAGVLHSYIHGFGVELMANSDNVLRGGLTSKHVDIPELIKVLNFSPSYPQIIKPGTDFSAFTYPAPCDEFSLTVMHGIGGTTAFAPSGPAICIVTEGEVSVSDNMILKKGESAFISASCDSLLLRGNYTVYAASMPLSTTRGCCSGKEFVSGYSAPLAYNEDSC